MISYLYRGGPSVIPVSRLIDVTKHLDLVANSIIYTPARARNLVSKYLESAGGCGCGPSGCGPADPNLDEFLVKTLAEQITGKDVFRVTTTAFLDAPTFDTRRALKGCLAPLLP